MKRRIGIVIVCLLIVVVYIIRYNQNKKILEGYRDDILSYHYGECDNIIFIFDIHYDNYDENKQLHFIYELENELNCLAYDYEILKMDKDLPQTEIQKIIDESNQLLLYFKTFKKLSDEKKETIYIFSNKVKDFNKQLSKIKVIKSSIINN